MSSVAGLCPGRRSRCIEVAHQLRVAGHGVPGDPHHHPGFAAVAELTRGGDQVADQLVAGQRDDAGSTVRPPFTFDLGAKVRHVREQRLGLAVACVAGREEPRRVVEVLVGKWANLQVRHQAPDDSVAVNAEDTHRCRASAGQRDAGSGLRRRADRSGIRSASLGRNFRRGPALTSSRLLLGNLEREHGERPIQQREPAARAGDRSPGARRVLVIALHRVAQVLVRHLDASDQLDPAGLVPHPLRLVAHRESLRRRCC